MSEKIIIPEHREKRPKSDLEEAAFDAGLRKEIIPREGTAAYDSVKATCEEYSEVVVQEMSSHSETFLTNSEKKRRSLHNKLCVQLYGTSWQDTAPKDRDTASRFAHLVSGKLDFIESLGILPKD